MVVSTDDQSANVLEPVGLVIHPVWFVRSSTLSRFEHRLFAQAHSKSLPIVRLDPTPASFLNRRQALTVADKLRSGFHIDPSEHFLAYPVALDIGSLTTACPERAMVPWILSDLHFAY